MIALSLTNDNSIMKMIKAKGGYLTQGVKSFDDGIQHNHQMNPPIKSFCVAFTAVFSAYFNNF